MAPYDLALHALGDETQMVDLDELKSKFLNMEFASRDLQIDADNLVASATASGEAQAESSTPLTQTFRRLPLTCAAFLLDAIYPSTSPPWAAYPWTAAKATERSRTGTCRHPIVGQGPPA